MVKAQVRKRQIRRGGLSLREDMPPLEEQPEMEYEEELGGGYEEEEEEEEDDLSDLLDEEPEVDDESGLALMAELDNVYKAQDERDEMTLQLAKAVRTMAKRLLTLEERKEVKAGPVKKEAPEGDFTVGGEDDLGDEIQGGGESQVPGLTQGQPQGIAQKAAIAKALAANGVSPDVIQKATGLIFKDDKWSNFGDKDSDIPANAPVTPDTKDWEEDFSIVPGSGNAPDSIKGIGSVAKALTNLGVNDEAINKMFEGAGFIRKAQAQTVGAGAQGEAETVEGVEATGRGLTFHQLNQMRIECGDL